ncbi:uncharacterized protein LOC109725532 isoform X2 [Ananas comosus]|uniref:Uncharacterized protein LOC109725532 isoform X2 n=1 Tax=Ananas comosus TaxID=4615 RepID=A0A6P5GX03_ANACO|nr:uncharacterized protein LOC109725532 isoform X2 [Ananas comosus]
MAALRTLTTARSSSASSSSPSSPSLSLSLFLLLLRCRRFSASSPAAAAAPPTPTPFMAQYLVDRVGFPPDKALYAASRSLSGLSSPARPDAVVSFLRGSASLSPPQILRFVRCRPSILAADVPSNLLPKLSLFRSLLPGAGAGAGAAEAPSELAALVTACASAFGYSAARLARSLAFLRDLYGGDDCGVVFALRRCPRLLSNDPDRVLSLNLAAVRDLYGGGRDPLPLIKRAPVLLTSSPERIALLFRAAEEVIGVGPESDLFPDAIGAVAPLSPEAFSNRVGMLRSYGFENTDLQLLSRHSPMTFRLKDHDLKAKLDFFTGTVGFTPRDILSNNWQINFSLDGRLRPRYNLVRGLQSKGLVPQDVNFTKVFIMAVERFNQEYVHKFVTSEGSNLVRSYMSSPAFRKEMPENGSGSSHSE